MHYRVGDMVLVTVGDDAGTKGKILRVDRENNKVVVEGVNRVYKHVRRSQKNPQGGRLSKEMPVAASNVAFIDPDSGKPTRVGIRFTPTGVKELFAKKSGKLIREVSPAKARYATKK